MTPKLFAKGSPELMTGPHHAPPGEVLSVHICRATQHDKEEGADFSFEVHVLNSLSTADQLALVEAAIQQLTEVKQTLSGESTKGTRS